MKQARSYLKRLWYDLRHLQLKHKVLVGVFLLLLVVVGFGLGAGFGQQAQDSADVSLGEAATVRLATVRELSQSQEPIRLIGVVSSRSEADIRSEAQGQITSVRVAEGDRVSRGQILATIENSSQQAALQQAQAALSAAQASIESSQALTGVGVERAERSLREAKKAAVNTLVSTYAQAEEALLNHADSLLNNALTVSPRLRFLVPSDRSLEEQIESRRIIVGQRLQEWERTVEVATLDTVSVESIDIIEVYAEEMRDYTALLVQATNSLTPSEQVSATSIQAWQTSASAARAASIQVISALSGIKNSLIQAETAIDIAIEEESQTSLGGSTTATAQVAQAESALRSAELALAKTVIRAPIAGIVRSLEVSSGDYVSIFAPVATVSNDNALEVVTYVAEEERSAVSVGAKVALGRQEIAGTVAQVSPTIDSSTQKVEIKITPATSGGLVDGQTISISIQRGAVEPDELQVPLTALKVAAGGFVVYTIDDSQRIVAIPVQVGPLLGDRVVLYGGVEFDTEIVVDVRGVNGNDKVEVAS